MSRPNPRVSPRAGMVDAPKACASQIEPARDMSWRPHLPWLREVMRRRFGADLADDIAQETYLRIVERAASEPVRNPRSLLMTVATNLARDMFRRARVRTEHAARAPEALQSQPCSGHTAEDDLQVKQAILSLPPPLRDVLLLSRIGGLTNREIAQRYGLSVRAIDKRLQKAIALFVAKLRD